MLEFASIISTNQKKDLVFWLSIIFVSMVAAAGVWLIIWTWMSRIPKGLEVFEDEIINS